MQYPGYYVLWLLFRFSIIFSLLQLITVTWIPANMEYATVVITATTVTALVPDTGATTVIKVRRYKTAM